MIVIININIERNSSLSKVCTRVLSYRLIYYNLLFYNYNLQGFKTFANALYLQHCKF